MAAAEEEKVETTEEKVETTPEEQDVERCTAGTARRWEIEWSQSPSIGEVAPVELEEAQSLS